MKGLIRTLVVDDSAFVRKVVKEILSSSPFIEVVGMARDGEEALEMAAALKPDVVTCDLSMPVMGGAEFVRRQMEARPVPILVLTAAAGDSEEALDALEAGAVDVVTKPTALATGELRNIRVELVEKVKAAARAVPVRLPSVIQPGMQMARPPRVTQVDVVVLGISTGGPQALRYLIAQFTPKFPVPLAVVLHMPVGYTAIFAEKLNELGGIPVREARDGEVLEPGVCILAQAGRHLHLNRSGKSVLTQLAGEPATTPHCPAVDVLFESAAEVYGPRVLGVVMTGMGDDGKKGAAAIKARGGKILTEAEESCVIYGMPRVVVEAGLSDAAFPLSAMANGIAKFL